MISNPKIFCAIDTADLDDACNLSAQIAPVTGGIKLGLEFFNNFENWVSPEAGGSWRLYQQACELKPDWQEALFPFAGKVMARDGFWQKKIFQSDLSEAEVLAEAEEVALECATVGDVLTGEIDEAEASVNVELATAHGLSPAQMSLAFLLEQPWVTSVIIGATNMVQLEENLGAIDVQRSKEVRAGIQAIHKRYSNPCP